MPNSNNQVELIKKIASQAWQQMSTISIPPSPENFLTWYAYYSNSNLDLKKEVDRLLESKTDFTPEVIRSLYKFTHQGQPNPDFFSEIHAETGEIITEISNGVRTTSNRNQLYQKHLGTLGENLKNVKNTNELQDVIHGLVNKSNKMESSSDSLHKLLKRASANIKKLEDRLEEVEKTANTDALTGIYNRYALEKKLSESCLALKSGTHFSLLMVDIDHFKQFNDTYGHRVGDVVLRSVAQTFAPQTPENAFSARYGGEEFVIILPDLKLTQALSVAEQLRETIARRKLRRESNGTTLGKITISLGVAEARAGDNGGSIVERADKALYRAKENGRNRVETEITE